MVLSTSALLTAAAVAVLGGIVTAASAQAAPTPDPTAHIAAARMLATHSAQPPKPGRQDRYRSTDSVHGLTPAVDRASHPGLGLCGGEFASLVTATGDLRGDGHTAYLVDTTCAGATGSTPDEVALYESSGRGTTRSAVLSAATATPRTSAYPYTWGGHIVVLAYCGDSQYRLVRLTPHAVDRGPIVAFR